MTVTLWLFLLAALLLISLLFWAARPQIQETRSSDEILQALAEDRHYHRLPQILQSLRPEDIEFLKSCGQPRWLDAFETIANALRSGILPNSAKNSACFWRPQVCWP